MMRTFDQDFKIEIRDQARRLLEQPTASSIYQQDARGTGFNHPRYRRPCAGGRFQAGCEIKPLSEPRQSWSGFCAIIEIQPLHGTRQYRHYWSRKHRPRDPRRPCGKSRDDRAEARLPALHRVDMQPQRGPAPRSAHFRVSAPHHDWREVVNHPDVHVVAELVGGTGVAREVIEASILQKKSVVTANKELMALAGSELWIKRLPRA